MIDDRPPANPDAYPACTCAAGECARRGHVPQPAACGHPGVFAHVPIPGKGYKGGLRSVCHRDACRLVAEKLVRPFRSQEAMGRAIGELTGVTGRPGGWIYDAKGDPMCQGWASYAHSWVGQRSGNSSTLSYEKGRGYLIGEVGLRRIAGSLDRRARKAAELAARIDA